MADASSSNPAPRRRSRAGCHTCKTRKVKCQGTNGPRSSCSNCQRLGFQCRWLAPVPGEEYVPPPKRRRAVGQRSRTEEPGKIGSPKESSITRDGDTGLSAEIPPRPATDSAAQQSRVSQNPVDAIGDVDGLAFDVDFGLLYNSLDLHLVGEGLEFVPLPAIDTSSLLYDTDSPTAHFSSWPSLTLTPTLNLSETVTEDATITAASESSSGGDVTEAIGSTSIGANNRHLIQHYLDVMTGYAKVDDNSKYSNNLFISAFTQSLHFPPLFHAILAFSASHLALDDPLYLAQAASLSRLAEESFDKFRQAENVEIDGLLSALFVRAKTVHMLASGVDSFLKLITAAVEIVSTKRDNEAGAAEKDTISPLTKRILVRLAILDGRASLHRLGGGQLVNLLRTMPTFSSLFARHSPPIVVTEDYALLNLLRAGILRMRVADLDVRLYEQLTSEVITQAPVRTDEITALYKDIQQEIDRWNVAMQSKLDTSETESALIEHRVLSPTAYGYYIVLSALHSALLYLYLVYPLSSFDFNHSISKVMNCQLKITHDPSRTESPSSMLPSSLFIAGLTTSDPVHIHWILELFRHAEKWGVYVKKGRELLEAMLRLPTGTDICDTMDKVTGRFII
ncbi:hypothetical protein VHEMI05479 [[Torrubiella] hemipterigena]|uniref:Zn(2)-C6 fungal-type domain-containing protein n=1 Tax=[Torrubiella] hemipterigena TaxID=1531966 RepID=A0A0A1TH52_9HYPO|nr:hypothetical protein VHEMI05479 [[Torrubiella] hemipterigena]